MQYITRHIRVTPEATVVETDEQIEARDNALLAEWRMGNAIKRLAEATTTAERVDALESIEAFAKAAQHYHHEAWQH